MNKNGATKQGNDDGDYYSKMISFVVIACYASVFGLNNLLLGDEESKFNFLFMKNLPFYVILTPLYFVQCNDVHTLMHKGLIIFL